MKKRLRIGWFTFACCEDNTIIMTEVMNDHWQEWSKKIDFVYARILKSKNVLKNLDVAFIEGAIATEKDAKRAKEIRKNSKYVIATGSCAVTGMPSAQRNLFDPETKKEIKPLLIKFKHREKVLALKDVIKVDDNIPGCPMEEKDFLQMLEKYLKKFKV
ncbi:hypothetical protein KY309_02240 [Candidatus Woesearchaeota archaeon]|nr:hypothetical protein [Candidatus Woesearchaeota archaeon]MBW3016406.1 hypothetical protein [Candidatus Woesearchaeota archaeon]